MFERTYILRAIGIAAFLTVAVSVITQVQLGWAEIALLAVLVALFIAGWLRLLRRRP